MKKIALVAMAVLLVWSIQYGQGQGLNNPVKVAHAGGGVRWSQCAFGPDGILHVIWEEDTDRGHPIYYVTYDGTTASTAFNVTDSLDTRAERPGIAAGAKGHIAVAWGVAIDKAIFMRVYDPKAKAWGAVESVKVGYGYGEPAAAVDPDGNVYVFWSDDDGGRVYSRAKINGTWEETQRLSGGYGKQGGIGIGPNGTIWAAWREKGGGGNYKNYYSKRTKLTLWQAAELVTTSGGSSSHPHLTVGPNNVAVLAWGDIDPVLENGSEIRIFRLEVDTTREIIIPMAMQHYPRVAVDKDNNIHIAYQIGGGDFGDGLRYTNNMGGSWMSAQTLPSTWPKLPGISADPYGNVAVCQSSLLFSTPGSDIWIDSLYPIEPRVFVPPLSLTSSIALKSARRSPEITYGLSWSANPNNKDQFLQGYNIYAQEGGGPFVSVLTVAKGTKSATFKYTDLNKKRRFAITTVGVSGIESDMVYFQ
jgi:hypothetical protein